jgi:ADP-heptose:LPS heptosyltransferase
MTGPGRGVAGRDAASPTSIGVYSFEDLLGDGLMKVAFLRGLRTAFPGARITWMTTLGSAFAHALRDVAGPPLLDEVVEHCGFGATPREWLKPPPRLGPFDLLLDTQRLAWRSVSAWRVPHRRFRTAATLHRGIDGTPVGPHALDTLFTLLETTAGRAVPRDLAPLTLPAALLAAAQEALPGPGTRRIAIAPGAGGATRRWPLERFAAVARAQSAAGREPVFLLGPEDAAKRAFLAAEVPGAAFPEDHPAFAALLRDAGPKPLRAVACAARCAAGVANDGGPGHMIAAAGTPLVSLFGPSSPAKFRPVSARVGVVRAQDFGGPEMHRIPVEAATEALEKLLAEA